MRNEMRTLLVTRLHVGERKELLTKIGGCATQIDLHVLEELFAPFDIDYQRCKCISK